MKFPLVINQEKIYPFTRMIKNFAKQCSMGQMLKDDRECHQKLPATLLKLEENRTPRINEIFLKLNVFGGRLVILYMMLCYSCFQ